MDTEQLTYAIRGAIYEVHKTLGPGLFESVYEAALLFELQKKGLQVFAQLDIPVIYKNQNLGLGFRLDLLVEDAVIIEIKSVTELQKVHKKQIVNYMNLTNKKLGFLVNFNTDVLVDRDSIIRFIND